MAPIFSAAFDAYTTPTLVFNAAPGTISGGAARTGAGGYTQTGSETTKQVAAADEHATFILHMGVKRGSPSGTFEWRFKSDSLATTHVTVQATATGELKVFRGTIAGTQLGSTVTAGTIPAGVYTHVGILVTLHDSTGVVTIWVNGAQVFTVTGADTKNAGTKTLLDSFGMIITTTNADVDDIILLNGAGSTNNGFLGAAKLETSTVVGAGTTTQLTSSSGSANYLNVDEATPNTSDYNGSATDNQFDTYAMSNLVTTGGTVFFERTFAYAFNSDAGTAGGAIMTRSGGTDYEGTDYPLGTGAQYIIDTREVDPATSAAWAISAINAMEKGFKKKAS